jgi:hypothetical protein
MSKSVYGARGDLTWPIWSKQTPTKIGGRSLHIGGHFLSINQLDPSDRRTGVCNQKIP